jgi:hypothetical protein
MFSIRLAAALLLFSLLTACDGGGGGGGGVDNGGRGSSGDGLTVGATSLTFTVPSDGSLPPAQNVPVTVTNSNAAQVGAGYAAGITPATWLNLAVTGTAPDFTFRFSVNPAGIQAGTRSTTVSIGITRSDGSVIAYRDVSVTLNVPPTLTLSRTAITLNYVIGGPAPTVQPVTVSGNGAVAWTASTLTNLPWLTLSALSGTTPTSINVGANPTGMTPGAYTTSVNFSGGSSIRTLDVTLVVEAPAIALGQSQLSFSGINGAAFTAQSLSVALTNGVRTSWTASSNQPWLVLGASSGTTPQTVSVSVDPAIGPLASGQHSATISFTVPVGAVTLTSVATVTLNLTRPTLTVSTPTIEVGGADGSDTAPVPVQLSLNTGTRAYPWSVSGVVSQAQLAPQSGSVSSTPVALTVQPLATLVGNTYSATATFAATVNGDTVTRQIPITVRVKPYHLFVHDTGVALTSTPTLSKLTASITVRDNRETPIDWTASSDQAWLTVTNGSGMTPDSFQLTADPTSLPMEAISYANVTVSSTDPRVTNTEIVRVGLYRTASPPTAQVEATVLGTIKDTGIVADPVRPYVYITHGTSTIDVYHIYSGALLHTIDTGAGSDLRSLAVDDEGSRLYAADHGVLGIQVVDIAAATPTLAATWTNSRWSGCTGCAATGADADLDYTRINGRGVLIGGASQIIDATDGTLLRHSGGSYFVASLAATISGDGEKMFTASLNSSGHSVGRYALSFNELDDVVSMADPLVAGKDGASRGLSTDYAGSVLYRACWYSLQQIERFDGETLATLSTVTSGTNGGALLGPDGLVYCARYYSEFSTPSPDLWAVDPTTGAVIASHEYTVDDQVRERQYTISGDGLRLLTRSQGATNSPTAVFTSSRISP